MSGVIEIRQAATSDLTAAQSWLADAGLPLVDLTPDHMQDFLLASANDRPVGMVGLEQFGHVALLRSLLVDPSARSGGIGRQLVETLEKRAVQSDVTELWLLTIDADAYFRKLGYAVAKRSEAPEEIRNTEEFSKLCPGDAVLMCKVL